MEALYELQPMVKGTHGPPVDSLHVGLVTQNFDI